MTQRNRSSTRAAPLALTHPNAAGIAIGSASHFVAVPPDRDDEPVREFRSFTGELERLADWLGECGIDTVAMASTGVYWIELFELLDARGFTVLLVNARYVKNVSGRKSDVLDCQWRAEHLFALKQALAAFDFCGTQLAECDAEIEAQLQQLQSHDGEPAKGKKRSKARNAPKFDLR